MLCMNFRRQMENFSLHGRYESGDILTECAEEVESDTSECAIYAAKNSHFR